MKQHPAGSYPTNSNPYRIDSAGACRKGLGLLVAFLALAATLTFSSCASQGLPGSAGNSANVLNGSSNSALPSAPSPFNTSGVAHDVSLTWNPSISLGIQGYNVYRRTGPAGPFTKLNTTALPLARFTDTSVQPGQTYYYVVTATDAGNVESIYSNEVAAPIP